MEVSGGDPELQKEREEREPRHELPARRRRLLSRIAVLAHLPPLPASIMLRYNGWQALELYGRLRRGRRHATSAGVRCEEGDRHGVERTGALAARRGRDCL